MTYHPRDLTMRPIVNFTLVLSSLLLLTGCGQSRDDVVMDQAVDDYLEINQNWAPKDSPPPNLTEEAIRSWYIEAAWREQVKRFQKILDDNSSAISDDTIDKLKRLVAHSIAGADAWKNWRDKYPDKENPPELKQINQFHTKILLILETAPNSDPIKKIP